MSDDISPEVRQQLDRANALQDAMQAAGFTIAGGPNGQTVYNLATGKVYEASEAIDAFIYGGEGTISEIIAGYTLAADDAE